MKLLDGIRVLDLTNVLSGPYCTSHLALMGAEVIKIENPNGGDLSRKLGCVPEYNQMLMGTSYIAQNANKKSVTLNLKTERAKDIFKKLVATADIVVENFRPGVMNRLGVGYDVLKEVNPKIIYCAISGFGQTGPDSKKPAYDQIIQGLSGVMSINGDETLNPLRAGFPLCDTAGGLNAAFAIMSALYYREAKGEGQFIDVSLLDSVMPMMGWVVANWNIGGQRPKLMGNNNMTAAPSGTFHTKDGYINIAANKQEQWENVADTLGVPELKEDPRFKFRDNRKLNREELTNILEIELQKDNTEAWVEKLNAVGVPSGAILKMEDAIETAQVEHRNTFTEVDVDGIGKTKLFNLTAKFEKTPAMVETAPPRLSQHTNEILSQIGIDETEVYKLKEDGVL